MTQANTKAAPQRAATPASVTIDSLRGPDGEPDGRKLAIYSAEAIGWGTPDKPEPGDEIDGHVLQVKAGKSELIVRNDTTGQPEVRVTIYPIVVILRTGAVEGDKAVAFHAMQAIPSNEVMSARPEFGDSVFIRYLGQGPDKSGRKGAQRYAIHFGTSSGKSNVWDVLSAARPMPQGATPTPDDD